MDYVLGVFHFPSGFILLSEESKEHEICSELQKSIFIVALSWLVGLLALHERRNFILFYFSADAGTPYFNSFPI